MAFNLDCWVLDNNYIKANVDLSFLFCQYLLAVKANKSLQ